MLNLLRYFFDKNKINLKDYKKYYELADIDFDNDGKFLNSVDNTIICTKRVFELLPIKQDKKNNYILNFDDIVPIRNREDFFYDLIKEFWGASMEDEKIDCRIDDEELIHIYFTTLYLPPFKIFENLIKKYKKEIICFSLKKDFNIETKSKLYYYVKNGMTILVEKEKTEEKQNNFSIGFFLPYHVVYYGEYVNCYSKTPQDTKYICSCQKQALYNKLKMFDDYMSHDYCLNDRKELLLEYVGLPDYYENIIKKTKIQDNYFELYDLFKFEDKICPVCCKCTT